MDSAKILQYYNRIIRLPKVEMSTALSKIEPSIKRELLRLMESKRGNCASRNRPALKIPIKEDLNLSSGNMNDAPTVCDGSVDSDCVSNNRNQTGILTVSETDHEITNCDETAVVDSTAKSIEASSMCRYDDNDADCRSCASEKSKISTGVVLSTNQDGTKETAIGPSFQNMVQDSAADGNSVNVSCKTISDSCSSVENPPGNVSSHTKTIEYVDKHPTAFVEALSNEAENRETSYEPSSLPVDEEQDSRDDDHASVNSLKFIESFTDCSENLRISVLPIYVLESIGSIMFVAGDSKNPAFESVSEVQRYLNIWMSCLIGRFEDSVLTKVSTSTSSPWEIGHLDKLINSYFSVLFPREIKKFEDDAMFHNMTRRVTQDLQSLPGDVKMYSQDKCVGFKKAIRRQLKLEGREGNSVLSFERLSQMLETSSASSSSNAVEMLMPETRFKTRIQLKDTRTELLRRDQYHDFVKARERCVKNLRPSFLRWFNFVLFAFAFPKQSVFFFKRCKDNGVKKSKIPNGRCSNGEKNRNSQIRLPRDKSLFPKCSMESIVLLVADRINSLVECAKRIGSVEDYGSKSADQLIVDMCPLSHLYENEQSTSDLCRVESNEIPIPFAAYRKATELIFSKIDQPMLKLLMPYESLLRNTFTTEVSLNTDFALGSKDRLVGIQEKLETSNFNESTCDNQCIGRDIPNLTASPKRADAISDDVDGDSLSGLVDHLSLVPKEEVGCHENGLSHLNYSEHQLNGSSDSTINPVDKYTTTETSDGGNCVTSCGLMMTRSKTLLQCNMYDNLDSTGSYQSKDSKFSKEHDSELFPLEEDCDNKMYASLQCSDDETSSDICSKRKYSNSRKRKRSLSQRRPVKKIDASRSSASRKPSIDRRRVSFSGFHNQTKTTLDVSASKRRKTTFKRESKRRRTSEGSPVRAVHGDTVSRGVEIKNEFAVNDSDCNFNSNGDEDDLSDSNLSSDTKTHLTPYQFLQIDEEIVRSTELTDARLFEAFCLKGVRNCKYHCPFLGEFAVYLFFHIQPKLWKGREKNSIKEIVAELRKKFEAEKADNSGSYLLHLERYKELCRYSKALHKVASLSMLLGENAWILMPDGTSGER